MYQWSQIPVGLRKFIVVTKDDGQEAAIPIQDIKMLESDGSLTSIHYDFTCPPIFTKLSVRNVLNKLAKITESDEIFLLD